ncbi:hypothetical protein [Nocardia brasiliensis]|uniref:hypothetical protein n=1 Tax=Nocardia brasiliensis TaxID=37326 RepID=UPI00245583EF|nr:hypothetical protein [Nocardia brasiliensis]
MSAVPIQLGHNIFEQVEDIAFGIAEGVADRGEGVGVEDPHPLVRGIGATAVVSVKEEIAGAPELGAHRPSLGFDQELVGFAALVPRLVSIGTGSARFPPTLGPEAGRFASRGANPGGDRCTGGHPIVAPSFPVPHASCRPLRPVLRILRANPAGAPANRSMRASCRDRFSRNVRLVVDVLAEIRQLDLEPRQPDSDGQKQPRARDLEPSIGEHRALAVLARIEKQQAAEHQSRDSGKPERRSGPGSSWHRRGAPNIPAGGSTGSYAASSPRGRASGKSVRLLV